MIEDDDKPRNDPDALNIFRDLASQSNVPGLVIHQAVWYRSGFAGCEIYALRVTFNGVECFTDGCISGADETTGFQFPVVSVAGDGTMQVHVPQTLPKDFRVWMDELYEQSGGPPSDGGSAAAHRTIFLRVDGRHYELERLPDGSPSVFYATAVESRGHVDQGPSDATHPVVTQAGQVVIVATPIAA